MPLTDEELCEHTWLRHGECGHCRGIKVAWFETTKKEVYGE